MYAFYLDDVRLPVSPSQLKVKINGRNKTVTLINDGEVNILKERGLTNIALGVMLPNFTYPFAHYDDGFKPASFYLDKLMELKTQRDNDGNLLPFQFIVSRTLPDGNILSEANHKVVLEDYQETEDAAAGFDVTVDITLKEYKAPKTVIVNNESSEATVENRRPAEKPPTLPVYTVGEGDTLSIIAMKQLGDASRYNELYEKNRGVIDAGNKGTGNTKYTVHPGQKLTMP